MDVRKYLHSKGLQWTEKKRPTGLWATMNCPFCGDTNKKFAVNLEKGTYNCLRENECGVSGSFTSLQRRFNDEPRGIDRDDKIKPLKSKIYKKPQVNSIGLTEQAFKFFQSRKIKESTLKHFGVSQRKEWICFNYYKDKELVNVKYRKITEKKFYREEGAEPTLYNMDNIENDSLYITEGEIDCLSLYEYGIEGVSIPSGVNDMTWISEQWEWLQRFHKIFIIMDNDKAGQEAVHELVVRLGKWRCYNVQLPEKDVNECLIKGISKEVIFQCMADATEFNFEQIKEVAQFKDEMHDIFTRKDKLDGLEIKYKKLQNIIKGWRDGEVSVWTGRNSSGKTSFINEIIIDICSHDEKAFLASLELQPKRLLRWMFMQLTSKETLFGNEIDTALNWFHNRLWLYDSTDNVKADDMLDAMEFCARKYGCKHFFIDSLMKIDLDTRYLYEEQKKFMNNLIGFAKEFKAHVHLVAHPRKGLTDDQRPGKVDIAGSGHISDLAFNAFTFYRTSEEQKEAALKKDMTLPDNVLYVTKNREHGFEGKVNFNFNAATKNFTEA